MPRDDEDTTTQELASEQVQRELTERRAQDGAADEEELLTHSRRADKARYLRERLAERERSEQEAE
jgi:hypothetical protein